MADLTIVASLLRDTNKKLDKLAADNEKSNSVTSIIAQSLPEILSDQQLAGRQERFDKKEGVTEVDEAVVKNTKKIVATLEETAVKTAKQAAAAAEKEKKAKEEARKVTAVVTRRQEISGKSLDNIEEASATFFKQTDKLEQMGADLKAQKRTTEDSKSWTQQNAKVNIAGLKLRKENNRGDMTRAQKRKINDEIREERKKTGGLFRTMANALTGIFGFLKKPLKVVGALLATLGLSAALYGLALLLESPFWPKITKFIGTRIVPQVKKFYEFLVENWETIIAGILAITTFYTLVKVAGIVGLLGTAIGGLFSLLGAMTARIFGFSGGMVKGGTSGTIKTRGGVTNTILKSTKDGQYRYAAGSSGTSASNKAIKGGQRVHALDMKNAKGLGIGSKGAGAQKTFSRYKNLGKFVKIGGVLGAAFTTYELMQIYNDDKTYPTAKKKARAAGPVVGQMLGAIGFGAIGAMLGGFFGPPGVVIGSLIGGGIGMLAGDELGTMLMEFLLGGGTPKVPTKQNRQKELKKKTGNAFFMSPKQIRAKLRADNLFSQEGQAFGPFLQGSSTKAKNQARFGEFSTPAMFAEENDFPAIPVKINRVSKSTAMAVRLKVLQDKEERAHATAEKSKELLQKLLDNSNRALQEQIDTVGSSNIVSTQDNSVTNLSFPPRQPLTPSINRGGGG